MKIDKYLQWLSFIVLVLLLWQLTLIMIATVNLFKSIEASSFEIESNRSYSLTPRLIHQMWKTFNLLTYPINNSHLQWKKVILIIRLIYGQMN